MVIKQSSDFKREADTISQSIDNDSSINLIQSQNEIIEELKDSEKSLKFRRLKRAKLTVDDDEEEDEKNKKIQRMI